MAKTLMETWSYSLQRTMWGGQRIHCKSSTKSFPLSSGQVSFFEQGLSDAFRLGQSDTERTVLVHLWLDRFSWAIRQPDRPANKELFAALPSVWWYGAMRVCRHAVRKINYEVARASQTNPDFASPFDIFENGRFLYSVDPTANFFFLADGEARRGHEVAPATAKAFMVVVSEIDHLPETSSWHKMRAEFSAYLSFCHAITHDKAMKEFLLDQDPTTVAVHFLAAALDANF